MFTSIIGAQLGGVVARLRASERRRGRRWALPLARRAVVGWIGLRTNLTMRELAAVFAISKSQAHRIVVDLTRRLAALLPDTVARDRRWSWIVDGTVPTRDRAGAAKAKNYRWSCRCSPGGPTAASSPSPAADPATATTRCTTAGPRSRRGVDTGALDLIVHVHDRST